MQSYTGFVWNNSTSHMLIRGAEADTPQVAKEEMLKHLQPFCEVRKVVTDEQYSKALAKARRENKRAGVAEAYHYC